MREKLTNDFLIRHDLPAPRVTYCNVYMNNLLWGLYTIVEEIDDEFCRRWFNSNDGNLFKGDPHGTLQWKGSSNQALYTPDYELKNNSTLNDWSDLISLINVINNTPNSNLEAALDQKLNTNDYLHQWAAVNLFVSLDSYLGSGHNYYIYHDTVTDKFQWIAWDNNESFGSFKMSLSSSQLMNLDMYFVSSPGARPLCEKMLINADYKHSYSMAYCRLKDDFTNAYFDPKIDSLRTIIQPSVYADPKKFYSNSKFDSSFNYNQILTGPGGITVFGLKKFIAERAAAVQNSINNHSVNCLLSVTENAKLENPYEVFPNPASDRIYISSRTSITYVRLYDIYGKETQSYYKPSEYIDVSAFSQGIYFIRINDEFTKKIMVY